MIVVGGVRDKLHLSPKWGEDGTRGRKRTIQWPKDWRPNLIVCVRKNRTAAKGSKDSKKGEGLACYQHL